MKKDSIDLTSSSENGNYSDTMLSATGYNTNAKYATTRNIRTTGCYDIGEWIVGTSFTTRSGDYIVTTGALKRQIYVIMEGYFNFGRMNGGFF